MKLYPLFFVSHAAAAAVVAAMFLAAVNADAPWQLAGAAVMALLGVAAVAWYTAARVGRGLTLLEAAVADHDTLQTLQSGLTEFDQAATKIGLSAQRWESIASHTRQQARELQAMLSLLNRRGASGDPTSAQLRDLLAGLGNLLHSHLAQIERGTSEIEQYAKSITEGSEVQGHAVIKATSYIEQLASTIDAVSTNAASSQSAMARNSDSAEAALGLVRELIAGMKRVRSESQTCEKKLRGLCDPSQQISAIVGTISDIAARTDLLALNASIESIRAGEHGRGFAIVAEEVRKLAEQASGATREIFSLIDSMQIVTQESIRGIERERVQVDIEVDRAAAAEQVIGQICSTSDRDAVQIGQITNASTQQLQLAQDIVLAIEQISQTAKANRSGADNVCWTMKSLSKMTPQFSDTIDRLRKCGDGACSEADPIADHDRSTPISASVAMPVTAPLSIPAMASIG